MITNAKPVYDPKYLTIDLFKIKMLLKNLKEKDDTHVKRIF